MSAVPSPVRRAASAAGRRIGRFELKSELGRGAQATVWLAYDPRLQREVAVKIINPDADAASVAQWLDEARAVSRLTHPNVVPVFEADQDGGVSFMVFEYVQGPTLTELLRKRGKLPQREAATLMRDVLDAVGLPSRQAIGAVQRVAQRYGRALDITLKDMQDALQPPAPAADRNAS